MTNEIWCINQLQRSGVPAYYVALGTPIVSTYAIAYTSESAHIIKEALNEYWRHRYDFGPNQWG